MMPNNILRSIEAVNKNSGESFCLRRDPIMLLTYSFESKKQV
jgi:hypothetical protein